jgi:hypothetical protein
MSNIVLQGWQLAVEKGVNKEYGGNRPSGYSATVDMVMMFTRILSESGYKVVLEECS